MKKIAFLSFLLSFGLAQFSLAKPPKVHVVTFRADWCPVTNAHEARFIEEITAFYKGKAEVSFVTHDLTDPKRSEKSAASLKRLGLEQALSGQVYTGVAYIVDDMNKDFMGKISIAEQSYKIRDFIQNRIQGKAPAIQPDKGRVWYLAIQYVAENGQPKLDKFNRLAQPFFERYGFKAEGAMKPVQLYALVTGENNSMKVPDNVVIFSAPDALALSRLAADPEYQKITPIRLEALNDFIFIETQKLF
ncbi:MAG: hypothetical protein AAF206_21040 [Bacteroidota bacterium]